MVTRLKILRMGGKEYFIDERLNQIRNVKNPHDFENVSPELIDFWVNHCIQREDGAMVCKLDYRIRKNYLKKNPDEPMWIKMDKEEE